MLFYIRPSTAKRSGGTITEDSFEFAGRYLFAADEDGNWELALLDSGTLTWLTLPGDVDLCLVGAGKDGGAGYFSGGGSGNWDYNDSFINSGKGGDSGNVYSVSAVSLAGILQAVIGTDGSDTTLGDYSSVNGTRRTGGRSASMRQAHNSSGTVNTGGAEGLWPYGAESDETMIPELQGHRGGASGGAGDANNNNYVWSDLHGGNNKGGSTDGADGGTRDHHAGYDATGYGNGGGGGYGDGSGHFNGSGGKGSQGMILIRNSRGGTT